MKFIPYIFALLLTTCFSLSVEAQMKGETAPKEKPSWIEQRTQELPEAAVTPKKVLKEKKKQKKKAKKKQKAKHKTNGKKIKKKLKKKEEKREPLTEPTDSKKIKYKEEEFPKRKQ